MAMKHRKLFPAPTSTNQTEDCTDPYYCYSYPDYSFPPPPPPPISTNDHVNHGHHISAYLIIIIVSLIASFFLLASYYVIAVKSCGGWISWRNNRTPQPQSDDTDEEFLDENRLDHPIWFITTVGLQHSIINSITVCKYKKGEGLIEGTDCSVCLSEFQEDETIRLLPKCNHAFHIPCIDTWLRSHTNCPLCRARIVSEAGTAPLASVEQNLDNMSLIVDTQMENSDINGNLGGNQDRRHSEICENRTETEEESEIVLVNDGRMLKESVNINGVGVIRVQKDDIQPVRRSVSMDASLAETISLGLTNHCLHESGGSSVDHKVEDAEKLHSGIVAKQDNGYSSMFTQMGSSSVVQYLHRSPVPMKRSFSCSGRFFSSRRHNHSLNGFLPL